jgi:hypothetical protein
MEEIQVKKYIIFGIGAKGLLFKRFTETTSEYKAVAALDNKIKAGEEIYWQGLRALNPEEFGFADAAYDAVLITPEKLDICEAIREQLLALGVPGEKISILARDSELLRKIDTISIYDEDTDKRVGWIKNFAQYAHDMKLSGEVAECGVYRGDLSMYINKFFYDKQLYLFDTFEGFTESDVAIERDFKENSFEKSKFNEIGFFNDTSVEKVLNRMPYPEKCSVRKGIFPDSAKDCETLSFCFVNLDMDLYKPQLEGLKFFYSRMVKGGVILCHDYWDVNFSGTKKAIADFEELCGHSLICFPIGDFVSMAIIKS